jgi:hypothetical protein
MCVCIHNVCRGQTGEEYTMYVCGWIMYAMYVCGGWMCVVGGWCVDVQCMMYMWVGVWMCNV